MVKKEWSKLLHNHMLLISSLVILFIPVLYAAFFLKSNWDPYGHTDELPVAVVNLDQPVVYGGKQLAVGEELVTKLKDNDVLDWHFVSLEDAQAGLKNREYYMVMTLPAEFSAHAATIMEEQPQKMEILYETNGSLNYISEIISKSAVKEIQSQVAANVTKAYADALFSQFGTIGEGFSQAAAGAQELNGGTEQVQAGNTMITENLEKLADSTLSFQNGADTLDMGLLQYTKGVAQVNTGAQELNQGIHTLAEKSGSLKEGVGQLNSGAGALDEGVAKYTKGVAAVSGGLDQLSGNSTALQQGASTLNSGASQLKDGSGQLLAGLSALSDALSQSLGPDTEKQLDALLDEQQGLPRLNAGIQQLNAALQPLLTNMGGNKEPVDSNAIEASLGVIGTNLSDMQPDLESAGSSLRSAGSALAEAGAAIQPNAEAAVNAVRETAAFQSLNPEQQGELLSALSSTLNQQGQEDGQRLTQASSQLSKAGASVTAAGEKLASAGSAAQELGGSLQQLNSSLEGLQQLTQQLPQLAASVDQLAAASNQAIPGAQTAITNLHKGLLQVQSALDRQGEGENKGLIQSMTELDQGLSILQAGLSGQNGLVRGINQYTAGVSQVRAGAQALSGNSPSLQSGASALANGTNQMNSQLPALTNGIAQLSDGAQSLAQGTSQLDSNSASLQSGSQKLAEGAGQIQDGSSQLAQGSQTLGEGISQLSKGSLELADKLQEGADEVSSVKADDDTLDMFASPAEIEHEEYSHVPNYGAALAPYIMSMALYIGAVVFNTIYPIRKLPSQESSSFSWWLSKLSIALPSAALMGIIETGILLLLGLPVQHVAQFVGLAVLTSMAFTTLVLFLTVSWDNVGRFIAMLLLIVQLGGSGGTFPMPLTNRFFMAIHPFLPMSYSVYGFRQAISDGLGQGVYRESLILMSVMTLLFSGLLYFSMTRLLRKDKERFLDEAEPLPEL